MGARPRGFPGCPRSPRRCSMSGPATSPGSRGASLGNLGGCGLHTGGASVRGIPTVGAAPKDSVCGGSPPPSTPRRLVRNLGDRHAPLGSGIPASPQLRAGPRGVAVTARLGSSPGSWIDVDLVTAARRHTGDRNSELQQSMPRDQGLVACSVKALPILLPRQRVRPRAPVQARGPGRPGDAQIPKDLHITDFAKRTRERAAPDVHRSAHQVLASASRHAACRNERMPVGGRTRLG